MRHLVLAVLALLAAGCSRDSNRWTPGTTGKGVVVVVAPIAAPTLAAQWPEGPLEMSYGVVGRIDFLGKGLDGFVGETLPKADARAWEGPVQDAAGAAVVLLVTLDPPKSTRVGSAPQITVEGTLKIVDPQGREEFSRRISGSTDDVDRPKLIGPSHTPLAEACAAAGADAANQAIDYLKARGNRPLPPPSVAITLTSTPANADVLVDGELKGTTPCTVQLPTGKASTLRLERQGHRPWERRLTPTEPLALNPALEPGN